MDWTAAGTIVSALGVAGGVVVFTLNRIEAAKRSFHSRVDLEVAKLEQRVAGEAGERKRDVERIDGELSGVAELRSAVSHIESQVSSGFEKLAGTTALIGEQVKGLSDRFGDSKAATERATDELKHTLRDVQGQVQTIAVTQAARTPNEGKTRAT